MRVIVPITCWLFLHLAFTLEPESYCTHRMLVFPASCLHTGGELLYPSHVSFSCILPSHWRRVIVSIACWLFLHLAISLEESYCTHRMLAFPASCLHTGGELLYPSHVSFSCILPSHWRRFIVPIACWLFLHLAFTLEESYCTYRMLAFPASCLHTGGELLYLSHVGFSCILPSHWRRVIVPIAYWLFLHLAFTLEPESYCTHHMLTFPASCLHTGAWDLLYPLHVGFSCILPSHWSLRVIVSIACWLFLHLAFTLEPESYCIHRMLAFPASCLHTGAWELLYPLHVGFSCILPSHWRRFIVSITCLFFLTRANYLSACVTFLTWNHIINWNNSVHCLQQNT